MMWNVNTVAEKAVWNWFAKHPPEEKPLTAIVERFTERAAEKWNVRGIFCLAALAQAAAL